MTAEDKNKVCKDLLSWAKQHEHGICYMEERIYAVSSGEMVTLVCAGSEKEAMYKVGAIYEQGKRDGAKAVIDIMNRGEEE